MVRKIVTFYSSILKNYFNFVLTAAQHIKDYLSKTKVPDEDVNPVAAVHRRRLSAENLKKEKEEQKKLDEEKYYYILI